MANRRNHTEVTGKRPDPPGKNPGKAQAMPEKTANWQDVPGPTQPGDRSNGVKKVKTSMKEVGC